MAAQDQRGSATAEVAILLPGLVLFLALVLAAGSGAVTRIRCVDAARVGARLAARGEGEAAVRSAVAQSAPSRAAITITRTASTVTVLVTAPADLPLPGVPAVQVDGSATAELESSLDEPAGAEQAP
jgi:hypothetical protein